MVAKAEDEKDEPTISKERAKRLQESAKKSYERLEKFRREHKGALRSWVGKHYGENANTQQRPVNWIETFITTYASQLAGKRPQVLITTPHHGLKKTATDLGLAANRLLAEINLGETLQAAVVQALLSIGIVRVGLVATGGEVSLEEETFDPGQPYAEPITIEDFVIDMQAKRYQDVQFIGHQYELPLEYAKEAPMFDSEVRSELMPTVRSTVPLGKNGSSFGADREGESDSSGSVTPVVRVWDLFLPHENLIVTITCDGNKVLRAVEYQGPENDFGPYHLLRFSDVPDHILPLPPVQPIRELDSIINMIWRKTARQAERHKEVALAKKGGKGKDDAEKVRAAKDGDIVAVDGNPKDAVHTVRTGGPDPTLQQLAIQGSNTLDAQAGNLSALGGLSALSETAKQDAMMRESAAVRPDAMKDRTINFATDVIGDLVWYLFYDPFIQVPFTKRIPGTDIDIPANWSADSAEGDYLDYNFEIEPHSMTHQGPAERLQTILSMVERVYMPLMPVLEQSGGRINVEMLSHLIAKYTNIPEMADLIVFDEPTIDQGDPVGKAPRKMAGMPARTERTYTRRSEATQKGNDQVMIQSLQGLANQGAE